MPPRIKAIPVAEISVPTIRVTAVYDEELEQLLRNSLDAVGQLVPILCVKTEEGYELIDGLHRLQEAKDRGDRTIPGIALEGDAITALTHNIITNMQRGKTRASEVVQVINELVHTHGLDVIQIQERTGLTRDYIERLWKIGEASPAVLDSLDRELIGVGVAFEVSRLPRFEQQEAVMNTVHTFRMTTKQAKEQVDEVLDMMAAPAAEPKVQIQRAEPEPPRCEVCNDVARPNLLVAVAMDPKCYGKLQYLVAEERKEKEVESVEEKTEEA